MSFYWKLSSFTDMQTIYYYFILTFVGDAGVKGDLGASGPRGAPGRIYCLLNGDIRDFRFFYKF